MTEDETMAKTQSMSISQFMKKEYQSPATGISNVIKKHKKTIEITGTIFTLSLIGILDFTTIVEAASYSGLEVVEVFNNTSSSLETTANISSIDAGAQKFYTKLVNIGKWVIIFKGAWDTINNTIKEDFDKAKRAFLQYLIIYLVLLAFPFALNEVEHVFDQM